MTTTSAADCVDLLTRARASARRLGHVAVGCEHLLVALAEDESPTGWVVREHGLSATRVEAQLARWDVERRTPLFAGIDAQALAYIGIDLDAIRARVGSSTDADGYRRPVPTASSWRWRLRHRTPVRVRTGSPIGIRAQRCLGRAAELSSDSAGPRSVTAIAVAVSTESGGLVPLLLRTLQGPDQDLQPALQGS